MSLSDADGGTCFIGGPAHRHPTAAELAALMTSGAWQPDTHTGAQKTQEILSDHETMMALAAAENEMVLAQLRVGILNLAQEIEIWEGAGDQVASDVVTLNRVQGLMERALRDRAMIRLKYKVSLL